MHGWGCGSPDDPGLSPDLRRHEPLRGAQTAATPYGGLGLLLEAILTVQVKEESGKAAVPGREEEDRCSSRPDLEDEEEWAKATAVVQDKGLWGE
jgi:hypothetical protein